MICGEPPETQRHWQPTTRGGLHPFSTGLPAARPRYARAARTLLTPLSVVPILLSALLTVATCVLADRPLNFANIIALPLLLGVGVAFNIYFVAAWRSGEANLLQSSLARAVLFSALTTATAFGSLWLSPHPGLAGLGELLVMSLGWTIMTGLLFEPALLGPPRRGLDACAARPEPPSVRSGSA